MAKPIFHHRALLPLLAAGISLALICSFGLHSLQIEHTHPGHTHRDGSVHQSEQETILSINEYIHGNEQKMFLFVVFGFLLLGLLYVPPFLSSACSFIGVTYKGLCIYNVQTFHHINISPPYLQYLFQKGILNPKLY